MVVTKYYCDCCGREIKKLNDRATFSAECKNGYDATYKQESLYCIDCWWKLRDLISNNFKNLNNVSMKADFFEKQVDLLKRFCKGYVMYDSEMRTITDSTVITNVWFPTEKVQRVLVDVKNEKVFVLDTFTESESKFLERLEG